MIEGVSPSPSKEPTLYPTWLKSTEFHENDGDDVFVPNTECNYFYSNDGTVLGLEQELSGWYSPNSCLSRRNAYGDASYSIQFKCYEDGTAIGLWIYPNNDCTDVGFETHTYYNNDAIFQCNANDCISSYQTYVAQGTCQTSLDSSKDTMTQAARPTGIYVTQHYG